MEPTNTVYLVDEQPSERRANCLVLGRLLSDPVVRVKIEPMAPYGKLSQYNHLLARTNTVAFIIDQKLSTTGEADYEGTRLASHLRAINTKLPLYILTNYAEDAKQKGEATVEDVIAKAELLDAKGKVRFKARFLRRIAVYRDVLTTSEKRFHDLLIKSLSHPLSGPEKREFNNLQKARALPAHAAELELASELDKSIGELKALLKKVKK